ncbi:MAG: hypothetical protein IT331_00265 [Anaerolineae bacterium]|nr:hypothetical protein [Anaerolineae bacterium]
MPVSSVAHNVWLALTLLLTVPFGFAVWQRKGKLAVAALLGMTAAGGIWLSAQQPAIEIVEMVQVPMLARSIEANQIITGAITQRLVRKSLPASVILDSQELNGKLALTRLEMYTPVLSTQISDYLPIPVPKHAIAPGVVLTDSFEIRNVPLSAIKSNTVTSPDDLVDRMALVALAPNEPIARDQLVVVERVPVPKQLILRGKPLLVEDFELGPVQVTEIMTDTLLDLDEIQTGGWQAREHLLPFAPVRRQQLAPLVMTPTLQSP